MSAIASCSATKYADVFLERLSNPSDLWKHAFQHQISEAARHILLVLGSCGDGIHLTDLRTAFEPFYLGRATQYRFGTSPSDFEKALDELEGNFIRIDRKDKQLLVSCHNPSILDFLKWRFCEHPTDASDILRFAVFFEQIARLFRVFGAVTVQHGLTGWKEIDPKVLQGAIDRTLLTWGTIFPANVWDRLGVCCRVGSDYDDAGLRTFILECIEAQMLTVDERSGEATDITTLLEAVERCEWCTRDAGERWNNMLFQSLRTMNDDLEETMDGLAATAKWFAAKRGQFHGEHATTFVRNLAKCVTREAEKQSAEQEDPEKLSGDLAAIQEIGRALKQEFSQEEDWLTEAISERRSKESGRDIGILRDRQPQSCTASIDAMFDALLE